MYGLTHTRTHDINRPARFIAFDAKHQKYNKLQILYYFFKSILRKEAVKVLDKIVFLEILFI